MEGAEMKKYYFCIFHYIFIISGMLIQSVKRGVVWVGDNFLVGRFSTVVYINDKRIVKRLRNNVFVKRVAAA